MSLQKYRVIELLAAASKKTYPEAAQLFEEMNQNEHGRAFWKLLESVHEEARAEGIEIAPTYKLPEDTKQVIYALQRCEKMLIAERDKMMNEMNYDAQFPEADAEAVGQAIAFIIANTPLPLADHGATPQPDHHPV